MKVLVCISQVPDTTSKINFIDDNSRFDTRDIQFVINPHDEFGLTRAMWLKEKQGATVTVVSVGGPQTESALRKALAIGADDAIRIDTPATDGMLVARQLAEITKTGNYNIVIAGRESIDYNGGMVPGMLAAMSGYHFVNACIGLEIKNDKEVIAEREIEGGKETLVVPLPAVLGVQKGIVEEKDLRIPNMRGIMTARKKPLKVVPPIMAAAATKSIAFSKPPAKSAVKLVDADKVEELIELLHSEAKVI